MSDFECLDSVTIDIIQKVTESVYRNNGLNLLFKYCSWIPVEICDRKVYYIAENKNNINYEIKMHIINEVFVLKNKPRFKKCIYCNNKKCNAKLSCCGKICHFQCATENNFKCKCSHKTNTQNKIPLSEMKPEDEDNYCIVCMDDCDTVTKCGHRICRGCIDQLFIQYGTEMKCPMCRGRLVEQKKEQKILMDVDIGIEQKVKVLIYLQA